MAALAAIESLLSARVAASLADTGRVEPDRELVGQGLASIAAGLFGGMPATGAIARTAVNVRSGGRSRLAAVVHAGVLLLVVLVAAGPGGAIPVATLPGVLMVTAVRMVHLAVARSILRSTRADAAAYLVTAVDDVAVVVLRLSQLELVGATGAYALGEIVHRLEARGVTVLIKGIREGHVELFRSVGVLNHLRHHRHCSPSCRRPSSTPGRTSTGRTPSAPAESIRRIVPGSCVSHRRRRMLML